MRKILAGVVTLAVTCAPFSIAWGQQIGRYQLIPLQKDPPLLVDTVTGRVWLFMPPLGGEPGSKCRGVSAACFHEIDRLQRTDQGWQSEVYPPKR